MLAHKDSIIPGRNRPSSWETLGQALSCISKDRRVFILVDAIDECEQSRELVNFFYKLRENTPQLSVLFTGREEIVTDLGCESLPRLTMEKYRVEVDMDIKSYIEKRLGTDQGFRNLSPTVKGEIQTSLHQKCAGMYGVPTSLKP